jgi:hypothetical protein
VTKVEVSVDGGRAWAAADLGDEGSPFAWRSWTFAWNAKTGEHELCVRATDGAGNVQPVEQSWSSEGVENNAVQRVRVVVAESNDPVQGAADTEL